ncbi:MAG: AraC family transcriptional regulator [Sphingomonadales bacterium]|nr:MAG: AraC family transcriptional regulator [Sphingomonadales bacterium]
MRQTKHRDPAKVRRGRRARRKRRALFLSWPDNLLFRQDFSAAPCKFRLRAIRNDSSGPYDRDAAMNAADPARPVSIRMLRPSEALSGLIDAYYIVETFGPMQDRYLAGPGNIRFAPRGEWILTVDGYSGPAADRAALFGPTDRSGMFGPTGPGMLLGAGLTPVGWAHLFDISADTLSNDVCELADVIGRDEADAIASAIDAAPDDAAIAAALDSWLVARMQSRPLPDPRIAKVHRALLDVPDDVTAFAAAANVSERTLRRLCLKAFGFPSKALLRQKRFQRTLERVRGVLDKPLTDLVDDGYYDQAHFNRDFRDYMGMSPTEYFNSPREIMRRSAEVRRTLNGAGLQGLHPAATPPVRATE